MCACIRVQTYVYVVRKCNTLTYVGVCAHARVHTVFSTYAYVHKCMHVCMHVHAPYIQHMLALLGVLLSLGLSNDGAAAAVYVRMLVCTQCPRRIPVCTCTCVHARVYTLRTYDMI